MTGQLHESASASATGPGRSDAGAVRLGQRDIDGLIICAEHYSISDDIIAAALARFADQYLLGHDRAAMLEIQLTAGTAELAAQRDRQAATLRKKLAKIETAQKGVITQIEQLGDDTSPGKRALRDRITEQYVQCHTEHAALTAELKALTTSTPDDAGTADPALLDELPYAPGLLSEAPPAIRQAIYAAFDIHCLYCHDQDQVTVWATITSTTPGIIRALINDPRTGTEASAALPADLFADLTNAAIAPETADEAPVPAGTSAAGRGAGAEGGGRQGAADHAGLGVLGAPVERLQ